MDGGKLFESIGFRCRPLIQPDGSEVHCIGTPFEFFDGDGVHVFAETLGGVVRVFDAGDTMLHIAGSGIRFRDNRSLSPIHRIVKEAGADLSDDGEISALAGPADVQVAFRNVLAAILGIARWEAENAGMTIDATTLPRR